MNFSGTLREGDHEHAVSVTVRRLIIFTATASPEEKSVGPEKFAAFRRALMAALFGVAGMFLGGVLVVIHASQTFSGETLVARVVARRLGSQEFELRYTPASGASRTLDGIRLRGDQWAVTGGIITWHPWLTMLGLKSYHKPLALSGRFSSLARQRSEPPSIYPLAPDVDRVWEALYRAAPYLPVIGAVYGSSAYVYVEPGAVQEVYVTPLGYLIKRVTRASEF